MRRREIITVLGGAAVTWPLAARAQGGGDDSRIGFLGPSLNSPAQEANYAAFLKRLEQLGFTEGKNLIVEYRRIDDPKGPFRAAAELTRSHVALIVASGAELALQAVLGASGFIPIVIQAINYDPIERGYVASLARPGGNITGLFYQQPELAAKQLELLMQACPDKTRLGVLFDSISADQLQQAQETSKLMHLDFRPLKLEKPPYDFAEAFRALAQDGAQMVLVLSSPFFVEYRPRIAALAIEHRLPCMFAFKAYVAAGGLMSYGPNFPAMYRRTADYVARILRGAKPADLPIERPTTFEFAINLKTAKAIGIELPTSILLRANEVIE